MPGPGVGRFVKNLTLEQVRRLDCGTRRADDGLAHTQVAVPGARWSTARTRAAWTSCPTVNAPEKIRALVAMGVDGLVSDYPNRLRRTARGAGVSIARR